jgi:VIT1/CCC1 family predicted Fe2+/Mn2+ transporter
MVHPDGFRVLLGMLADHSDGRRLSADEKRQLDDLEQRLLHGPAASPRSVPVGLAAAREPLQRMLLLAGVVVTGALLVLAVVVGGPGGLAATAVALIATSAVCLLPRLATRARRR